MRWAAGWLHLTVSVRVEVIVAVAYAQLLLATDAGEPCTLVHSMRKKQEGISTQHTHNGAVLLQIDRVDVACSCPSTCVL